MHGKSRVSSATSVCHNKQNFNKGFTIVAVAQWVRRGSKSQGGACWRFEPGWRLLPNYFSAMIFISVLLGLTEFSDIVILCGRSNSCCQQNLKSFDMPYYPQVCFHERVAMTVKQI